MTDDNANSTGTPTYSQPTTTEPPPLKEIGDVDDPASARGMTVGQIDALLSRLVGSWERHLLKKRAKSQSLQKVDDAR